MESIASQRVCRRRASRPTAAAVSRASSPRAPRTGIRSRTRCVRWRRHEAGHDRTATRSTTARCSCRSRLPIEWSEAADESARQLVAKMGFHRRHRRGRAQDRWRLFLLRRLRAHAGRDRRLDDRGDRGRRARSSTWTAVDALIRSRIGRKIRIAGACIGTDAHTVGIDAILNMKGYKGDYGLERYHEFEVFNLGVRRSRSKNSCASPKRAASTRCSFRRS